MFVIEGPSTQMFFDMVKDPKFAGREIMACKGDSQGRSILHRYVHRRVVVQKPKRCVQGYLELLQGWETHSNFFTSGG